MGGKESLDMLWGSDAGLCSSRVVQQRQLEALLIWSTGLQV